MGPDRKTASKPLPGCSLVLGKDAGDHPDTPPRPTLERLLPGLTGELVPTGETLYIAGGLR